MSRKINKVLIANRGEIAVRVIKTCRKLGISTAIAFSDADAESLAVKMADEAVAVGETNAYLSIEKMIQAAKLTNADAIHPGFGFLSENAEFSQRVEEAGIIFIGPTANSISSMGSKIQAKVLLTQPQYANVVPVIPGYNGSQDDKIFLTEANKMGYPVLLKASAGGGGKGMRVVWKPEEFLSSLEAARREAMDGFGDSSLLLEKYFASVRHVEIQIFADNFNNCVSLFERDCSIQRRHQKIIEESPSPVVDSELRKRMGEVAVTIGKAINYRNAGTVEFILDENNKFYFLEVNTRLQVEHPITEAITGLDLVELQIRVAEGNSLEQLGLGNGPSRKTGHAMECRIYAEDPKNNFLPAPGRLIYFIPAEIEGVRYDSGVESGSEITMYYDPMIAKVIAYGETRHHCIQRMIQAIKRTAIVGLTTNQHFLLQVLSNEDFQRGDFNTHFIQNHPDLAKEVVPEPIYHSLATAATLFIWNVNRETQTLHRHVTPNFRNLRSTNESKVFRIDDQEFKVEYIVRPQTHGQNKDPYRQSFNLDVKIGQTSFPVSIEIDSKSKPQKNPRTGHWTGFVHCKIDTIRRSYFIYNITEKNELHIQSDGLSRPFVATLQPKLTLSIESAQSSDQYKAPMAGRVVSVLVEAGGIVKEGDVLLILESMKTETKILSFKTGEVAEVFVVAGQVVEEGQSLIFFKKEEKS